MEGAEEDRDVVFLQCQCIGSDFVEIGVIDFVQIAAGHHALDDIAIGHDGGETGEVVFTADLAFFRNVSEVRHMRGERDDGALLRCIFAEGDGAVDGCLSCDRRQGTRGRFVVLVLGVVPRECHRVYGDEGRVVFDHAVGIGACWSRMHQQVVHVAVEYIVGVGDASEEGVEAGGCWYRLCIGEDDRRGDRQGLQIQLMLFLWFYVACHIAIIIRQGDIIDAQ